jgi:hypothetical protein
MFENGVALADWSRPRNWQEPHHHVKQQLRGAMRERCVSVTELRLERGSGARADSILLMLSCDLKQTV